MSTDSTAASPMRHSLGLRRLVWLSVALLVAEVTLTVALVFVLPPMLLEAGRPQSLPKAHAETLARLTVGGGRLTEQRVRSADGTWLRVHRVHRTPFRGVAISLHGFGDDAYGTAALLANVPELDAVFFTFRALDEVPGQAATLGAWERNDVVAVVHALEREGVSRSQMVLVGVSQGAGVALLALERLEREGGPLGAALLESPFADLRTVTVDHVRSFVGDLEPFARPGEWFALRRAGALAGFHPDDVDAVRASRGLRTPISLAAGDADRTTRIAGVRSIARSHPDLVVVRGADHGEIWAGFPGGFSAWARPRLERLGLL